MDLVINKQIIDDFIPYVDQLEAGTNIDEKFKISMSIGLFLCKVVSLERAAELAGKRVNEYIELLIEKDIFWSDYTEEGLKFDELSLEKYRNLSRND